jgi:hypothetical protein
MFDKILHKNWFRPGKKLIYSGLHEVKTNLYFLRLAAWLYSSKKYLFKDLKTKLPIS